jgi:4-amino-4-deoxy-L-arabinose transferase-like glycosyltransferase
VSRKLAPVDAAIVLAQASVFLPVALRQAIDDDEGSYVLAAKLILSGKIPYRDFFLPQLPVLPYVVAGWAALAGESWIALRLLTAAIAVVVGALLYVLVMRQHGRVLGTCALIAYTFSTLCFLGFTYAETESIATLCLLGALIVLDRPRRPEVWALAGVLTGLAINARLLFAVVVPVLAWEAFRTTSASERTRTFGLGAGGLVVGLLPAIFFFFIDPHRFLFDTLGSQGARSSSGLIGDFPQKVRLAENMLGVGQNLVVILTGVVAAVGLWLLGRRVPLTLWLAGALTVVNFLPTPSYDDYFSVVIPFVIAGAADFAMAVRERPAFTADRDLARVALAGLAGLGTAYVVLGVIAMYPYLRGVGDPDFRLSAVRNVQAVVNARARPGVEVLSSWPGYLYGTDARPVPSTESDFSPRYASSLSAKEARRYHLATAAEVEAIVRSGRAQLVVVKLWHHLGPLPDWDAALASSPYYLVASVGGTRIYALRP